MTHRPSLDSVYAIDAIASIAIGPLIAKGKGPGKKTNEAD